MIMHTSNFRSLSVYYVVCCVLIVVIDVEEVILSFVDLCYVCVCVIATF